MPQAVDEEKPLIDHIEELIHRLRISIIAILASTFGVSLVPANLLSAILRTIGGYVYSGWQYTPLVVVVMKKIQEDMFAFDREPFRYIADLLGINDVSPRLIASGWFDVFTVGFYTGLMLGITVASPIVAYEIYMFVNPALYSHEKRMLKIFVASFTVLFLAGAAYAYNFLMPLTFLILLWLTVSTGAEPLFTLESFFTTVFLGIIATAIFFTYPVLLVMLTRFGVLTPKTLREKWRYIVLGIFVITSVITPDPTPITMLLLSIPFILLYGLALVASEIVYRKKKR